MKRKLCILTSVLWIFVVTLSGCYYTADAEFTFPEEKKETTEATPKPQGQMEYSYLRGGVVQTAEVADRYFAEYLPTLYTVGDTYDCFFTDPENPNSFTIDISYRLVDWGMCDTMPEVFHDLSEEEKQELVLDEGERYAYCTIEVTGGERHVNETIDVSHVKWVGVTEKDDRLCRISAEKYKTHFMPREFAHTVHDGNRIAMAKGVTKRLYHINIIPEEWIGQEIYLEIDPLGLNMFENHGPGELSEEWRNKEAIYKLSGEYIPTEKPQATPVAPRSTDQFRIDWPFENCQVIQPGETASYKGNKYTDLILNEPYVYTMIYLMIIFLFSGGFTMLSFAISPVANNKFVVYILPFAVVGAVSVLCDFFRISRFSPWNFLVPEQHAVGITWWSLSVVFFVLVVVPTAAYFIRGRRSDIL